MILIYTKLINPRIKYIFNHIFCNRLGVKIDFTSSKKDFIKHESFKMSYNDNQIMMNFILSPLKFYFLQKLKKLILMLKTGMGFQFFLLIKKTLFLSSIFLVLVSI